MVKWGKGRETKRVGGAGVRGEREGGWGVTVWALAGERGIIFLLVGLGVAGTCGAAAAHSSER